MLISPPFLLINNGQAADTWLDTAMTSPVDEGGFPVTKGLIWHGGLHLVTSSNLPVRAIADGTIVYVRGSSPQNSNQDDPLNYHAGANVTGWTSDGCVIIQHDTEIGDGVDASIRFFSVSMHLEEIPATVVRGRPIYRKDVIGNAGWIYGRVGQIHFEIICDDSNLEKIVGRVSGDLPTAGNGRLNAVYGDTHFHVPTGASFYAARPTNPGQIGAAMALPESAYTTTEDLFISTSFNGDAYVSTFRSNGDAVGNAVAEEDAEYLMYKAAKAMNTRCTSAAYELLRFGRVLSGDVLSPENTPHWRKARYPGGQGWINLASAGIHAFSDADFPHWRGWKLVDDSAGLDSRMDSALIRGLLDTDGDRKVSAAEARMKLEQADVKSQLKHLICKIPCEWSVADIDKRWSWLKKKTEENPDKLDDDDFSSFKAHLEKLCFWEDANLGIPSTHWHFQPREFIRHFKKCEWYSSDELARCIPRRSLSGNTSWASAIERATNNRVSLNIFFRKYIGPKRTRHVHALAQIYIETGVLSLNVESGSGNGHDYGPFYGRGYMQLTWGENYEKYGKFKNLSNQSHPTYVDSRITTTSTHPFAQGEISKRWSPRYDPDVVGTVPQHRADSSGYYWVSKTFRGTSNINRVCDIGLTPTEVGFISWLINGGPNGYVNRQQFVEPLKNALLDFPWLIGSVTIRYPAYAAANMINFPPIVPAFNSQLTVDYQRQIP